MKTIPRWLLVVLVLAIGGVFAAGGWFYRVQQAQMRQNAEAQLQAVARLKVKEIANWRENQLGEGRELAASGFFGQGVARWLAEPQAAGVEPILTRFRSLRDHYHYRDVILVDPAGTPRLSLSGRLDAPHAEDAQALATALRDSKPVLTDLHSNSDRRGHFATVVPIFPSSDPAAKPGAVVVLEYDVERFLYPMIQTWPVPSRSAETLLVRRDGDSVLVLSELRHQTNAALKLRIPLTQAEVPAVMAVLGRTGVVEGRDYRGVPVVSVLAAIPDSPWFLVAKVDSDEVFAVWRTRSVLILAVMFGLTGIALGTVGIVWQRNLKAHFRALYRAEAARGQAESRHRVTLQSIGDAVIVTDGAGRVEMLNPVAEALTGWKPEEACGQPLEQVFRIISEDTRQPGESPVTRVLREGMVVGLANHTLIVARDGTERPIADSGAPIRDGAGGITGVVLVFRDQTEERRAQQALQASESRHRLLIEHLHAGVVVHAPDTQILLANRQASALLGLTVDQMMGRTALDPAWCFVREDETAMPLDEYPVNCVLRTREPLENQVVGVNRSRTGNRVWVLVNAFPEFDAGGALRQVVVTFVDITDRKAHEHEIERLSRLYATLSQINQAIVRVHSIEELAREVTRVAVAFGGFKLAWVGRHDPQTAEVAPLGWSGEPQEFVLNFRHTSSETAEHRCSCSPAIRENRSCVTNDLTAVPGMQTWASVLGPGGIRAAAVFPIRVRGAVWGVLGVYSGESDVFRDKEITLLEEAAMDVGYAVEHIENEAERKRAEDGLRQSEERLRFALESSHTGAWDLDLVDHTAFRSLEHDRIFGYEALLPAWTYEMFLEHVLPEDRAVVSETFHRATETQSDWSFECRVRRRDGEVRWILAAGRHHPDAGGKARRMAGIVRDITERKQAEEALHESERIKTELLDKLNEAQHLAGIGNWEWDLRTKSVWWSDETYRIFGVKPEEYTPSFEANSAFVHPEDLPKYEMGFEEALRSGKPVEFEGRLIAKDGQLKHCQARGHVVRNDAGQPVRFIGTVIDVTRKVELEAQLRQAQKLEAVGQLAGGVAHDFNNLLAVILLQAEFSESEPGVPPAVRESLLGIRHAADRGGQLTRQLLLFSRRQVMQPLTLDLNEVVGHLTKMLQRILGEDIKLEIALHPAPLWLYADRGMLEQVLMNLAVNARDAMPKGGSLRIATEGVTLDEGLVRQYPEATPGRHARLRVTDSGCGIAPDVLPRIFEPFFTTKEAGKGTGLGLATVFGIVKQHRGWIRARSELDKGATFEVFLPTCEPGLESVAAVDAANAAGGTETILLVEDESAVRMAMSKLLAHQGYHVLEASHGPHALSLARQHSGPIHLLVTDVVMPEGMDGHELAAQMRLERPGIKAIFMSGFSPELAGRTLVLQPGEEFIQKPCSSQTLLATVRRCLEE